jgi:FkbM family methyltransferase
MTRGETVPPSQTISYAQRYEDMHLLRCFGAQPTGFYIDAGAGHPVYDNVSFAFYLRGWRGITVEPNPWLSQLSEAVRPRDTRIRSLVGAAPGEATYYLVEDFLGLSTTVEGHARAAHSEFGKRSRAMIMPVTTLRALCEQHAPSDIDFLKIDVEGAERAVIEGGDWRRFRPKILVLEALAPVTMAPSWDAFEPLILSHGYRFAFFDSLNRYYVADEHGGLATRLAAAPDAFPAAVQLCAFKPALDDPAHPDHGLALLLAGTEMVRLPLLPPDEVAERLTASLEPDDLSRPATRTDLAAVHQRLFGKPPPPEWDAALALRPSASLRDLYRHAVTTDTFRAACGRISASYAW